MNTLVVIGTTGNAFAYLNVPVKKALRRYKKKSEAELDFDPAYEVRCFEFEDEFEVYWAGPLEDEETPKEHNQ